MDPAHAQKLILRPVVAMHREPDAGAEQVTQASLGMPVTELEARGGWRRIRTPDGYDGWAEAAGLSPAPEGWGGPWAEVTDLWVNLRPGPDYRLASAQQAFIGTRLPLVERREGWAGLLLPDGRRVWTESRRVQEAGEAPLRPATPEAVCRTALRFRRVPYLWGGVTPAGLDCSGFVQLVMRLHGVSLLRDADQQAAQGEPCPDPDLGDLVFFATGRDPRRISHVGLMLGRRRFVHAAGGDRVRINRLEDEPYPGQFLLARRFLQH